MHNDWHATGLQQESYTHVIDAIKKAGKPCTIVFGDGFPDAPLYALIHSAYRAPFDRFAAFDGTPSETIVQACLDAYVLGEYESSMRLETLDVVRDGEVTLDDWREYWYPSVEVKEGGEQKLLDTLAALLKVPLKPKPLDEHANWMAQGGHYRRTWVGEGTLGIKLRPRSGCRDKAQGIFCAAILNPDLGLPEDILIDAVVHEAMCDDVHGIDLHHASFTQVGAMMSMAGTPPYYHVWTCNPRFYSLQGDRQDQGRREALHSRLRTRQKRAGTLHVTLLG